MKHLIKLAFLLLALLLPATATAHDFMVNGIYYNILNDNEVEVTYQGTDSWNHNTYSGSVAIPSSVIYNSLIYSVTSIGNNAFSGCSGLTSVDIPNSVTTICSSTFSHCTGLTSVIIPNSVTSISSFAFSYCSGLTSVTIPNSVTSIGSSAFSGCSRLTSINIPNSVTSIRGNAFRDCSGLTSINVASGNTVYDARNNCNAIIETASNSLIAGCNNTIIPNSVTSIGNYAFYGCSGLTSVTIPNTVTSIGGFAFYGCSGLNSVDIPNSVTTIGSSAFSGCRGLTSIEISNSITTIDNSTFSNCIGLTSVAIPKSVTSIGINAFLGCSALTSIEIPNSVTSIGYGAFEGTAWYNDQPNGMVYTGLVAYKYKGTMPEGTCIILQEGTKGIAGEAFSSCIGLTSVSIPSSITSIGSYAFYGTAWFDNQPDGLVYAGLVAYKYKGTMPQGTSITLQEGTKGIAGSAFSSCIGLTSIDIPNSVTSIGEEAFAYCSSLASVSIPNSVTSIGFDAFSDCIVLNKVFSYITDLSSISMGSYVFDRYSAYYGDRTLHVPAGTSAAYQADTKWSQYFGQIVDDLMPNLPGDVNGDFEVNIADVNAVINIILGGSGDTSAADVNGDGEINIADTNTLIDMLLSGVY